MAEQVDELFPFVPFSLEVSTRAAKQDVDSNSHYHLQEKKAVDVHCWYPVLPSSGVREIPCPQISPRESKTFPEEGRKENKVTTEVKKMTLLICLFLGKCRLPLIRVSRTSAHCSCPSEESLSLTFTSSSCVSAVQSSLWRRALYTVTLLYASFSSIQWNKDLFTFRKGWEVGMGKQQRHPQ